MEKFIDIKGFKGLYQISNLGRVKALSKKLKNGKGYAIRKEKFLAPAEKENNYFFVNLGRRGVFNAFYVHRLVAIHFIPNPEKKREVNHKDCNKSNNVLKNLEWTTRGENLCHSYKNGTHKPKHGTISPKAKLTDRKVRNIKKKYNDGNTSLRKLAAEYKVTNAVIWGIIKGFRWPHVK